ncbi:PREDICTED: post-GPI attachment to proteins factor 2-like [Rhagoletis zephyria]|uniref:post-GPI attachment to proteins factor 2-like n=1 Tax=Rhagoletis zephyria TaxID=28612 RepID=UPI00081164B3|nr:PREDICTED: post-GPI attachment to proteins factor 2-like [Rhagoletis zephyria]
MADAVSTIDASKDMQDCSERPAEVCQSDSGGGAILRNTKQLTALPLAQQANNEQSNDEQLYCATSSSKPTTDITAAAATSPVTGMSSLPSTPTTTSSAVVVHFFASFHRICVVTALLPLVTLFTCFVTAYVFQYDDVHETHCRVYNIVPSISAITGVSPQRYFWRLSIALHIGPRFPIAFVYKNFYRSMLGNLQQRRPHLVPKADLLISLILILNIIEISSLGGVTYISNRENYPIHEKIFITFMVCSLCYMLATIKLHGMLFEEESQLLPVQRESIKWKKILFAISIVSTVGLLFFFAKHRFYCHDLAFSWFAFFEYVIAIANMLFHFTIIWDFPSQFMIIVQGPKNRIEEVFKRASGKWE